MFTFSLESCFRGLLGVFERGAYGEGEIGEEVGETEEGASEEGESEKEEGIEEDGGTEEGASEKEVPKGDKVTVDGVKREE